MKTIKLYSITLLIMTICVIQVNAQLKIDTTGNVSVLGNKLHIGASRYLGIPSGSTNFSLITHDSWLHLGSDHAVAIWGGEGADGTNSNYDLYIDTNGIGVNGWQPWTGTNFVVNGNGWLTGNMSWGSDKRFKERISLIKSPLEKVLKLSGKTYNYRKNQKSYHFSEGKHYGFIAQELKEVLPELVTQNPDGYYGVNYVGIIPFLVEAIKEQQIQIENLKNYLDNSRVLTKNIDVLPTVILYQNVPNPFTEKTVIKYVIPENVQKVSILIFNMQGTLIKSYDNLSNNGELTINGGELEAGMYMYSLIVDGKEIDTKKMILSK
jgi:hypothetical protein